MKKMAALVASGLLAVAANANAKEYPVGGPVHTHHLEIASAYLKDIETSPMPVSMDMDSNSVHLETDVHALADNPWGFKKGSWIPYLNVDYVIRKKGDPDFLEFGHLLPMSAADGPHYAHTVQLAGKGEYTVSFKYYPPDENGYERHTDKATGVSQWFKPFVQTFNFEYPQKG